MTYRYYIKKNGITLDNDFNFNSNNEPFYFSQEDYAISEAEEFFNSSKSFPCHIEVIQIDSDDFSRFEIIKTFTTEYLEFELPLVSMTSECMNESPLPETLKVKIIGDSELPFHVKHNIVILDTYLEVPDDINIAYGSDLEYSLEISAGGKYIALIFKDCNYNTIFWYGRPLEDENN